MPRVPSYCIAAFLYNPSVEQVVTSGNIPNSSSKDIKSMLENNLRTTMDDNSNNLVESALSNIVLKMIGRVWCVFLALYRNHAKAPGVSPRDGTSHMFVSRHCTTVITSR